MRNERVVLHVIHKVQVAILVTPYFHCAFLQLDFCPQFFFALNFACLFVCFYFYLSTALVQLWVHKFINHFAATPFFCHLEIIKKSKHC